MMVMPKVLPKQMALISWHPEVPVVKRDSVALRKGSGSESAVTESGLAIETAHRGRTARRHLIGVHTKRFRRRGGLSPERYCAARLQLRQRR